MRFVAATLATFAFAAPTFAAPDPAFAPLAFLAGHCWKGTFPDGKKTDEHCFAFDYGGRYLRDHHVVEGGDAPYEGETVFAWDAERKAVVYFYWSSAGGYSHGRMTVDGRTLDFPEDRYVADGKTFVYRSRWKPVDDNAYDVLTEQRIDETWKPAWSMRMQRVAPGAQKAGGRLRAN